MHRIVRDAAEHLRECRFETLQTHPELARRLRRSVQPTLTVQHRELDMRAAQIPAVDHRAPSGPKRRREGAKRQRKITRDIDIEIEPLATIHRPTVDLQRYRSPRLLRVFAPKILLHIPLYCPPQESIRVDHWSLLQQIQHQLCRVHSD